MLDKIEIEQKNGNESLTFKKNELGIKLIDFWKWSVSDLVSNATRGRFAEFIVATALNVDLTKIRDEWGAYDLESPEGIKIEVKSSAYLQSWFQKELSGIYFNIRKTRKWDEKTGKYSEIPSREADIYVFCLLNHKDKTTIEPLNLEQWEFFVLSTPAIDNCKHADKSMTLKTLQKLTKGVSYDNLRDAVIKQYERGQNREKKIRD